MTDQPAVTLAQAAELLARISARDDREPSAIAAQVWAEDLTVAGISYDEAVLAVQRHYLSAPDTRVRVGHLVPIVKEIRREVIRAHREAEHRERCEAFRRALEDQQVMLTDGAVARDRAEELARMLAGVRVSLPKGDRGVQRARRRWLGRREDLPSVVLAAQIREAQASVRLDGETVDVGEVVVGPYVQAASDAELDAAEREEGAHTRVPREGESRTPYWQQDQNPTEDSDESPSAT
jgi:hypothetical protein